MFISMKGARTPRMYCLVSLMAKKMNICSHDGRSIQELPHDFTLEMGLRTCRWDFALHTGKSHVQYKLLINGLFKSWDLPLPWDLFIQEGFGTWDHVWTNPYLMRSWARKGLWKFSRGPWSQQTREFSTNYMWDLACLKALPRVHTHIEAMKC